MTKTTLHRFKMADDEDACDESGASFSVYLGMVDPRLERLLWHLEDEPKKDVVAEIASEFEIEELLNAREKLFERALKKAKAAQPPDEDIEQRNSKQGCKLTSPRTSKYIAIPWTLIKRRIVSLAAMDICEIYLYLIDPGADFPSRILKRKPLVPKLSKAEIAEKKMEIIPEGSESDGNVSKRDQHNRHDELDSDNEPSGNMDHARYEQDMPIVNAAGKSPEIDEQIKDKRHKCEMQAENDMIPEREQNENDEGDVIDILERAGERNESITRESDQDAYIDGEIGKVPEDDVQIETKQHKSEMNVENGENPVMNVENGKMIVDVPNEYDSVATFSLSEKLDERFESITTKDDHIAPIIDDLDTIRALVSKHTTLVENNRKTANGQSNSDANSGTEHAHIGTTTVGGCARQSMHEPKLVPIVPSDDVACNGPTFRYANEQTNLNMTQQNSKTGSDPLNTCELRTISKPTTKSPKGNGQESTHANEPPRQSALPTAAPKSSAATKGQTSQPIISANELLDGSDISQASFLREIFEIHSRVTASSPKKSLCCCRHRKQLVDMASQTSVNIVADKPVMKSEHDCSIARIDRALTDHERRTRSIEIWQNTVEGQVAKVDADAYNNNLILKTAFEMVIEELQSAKEIVGEMVDQANERDAIFEKMVERDREREMAFNKMMESGCKCKTRYDMNNDTIQNEQAKNTDRGKQRDSKEKDSVIDSFMKAARKVVGPNPVNKRQNNQPKGQVKTTNTKVSTEAAGNDWKKGRGEQATAIDVPETPTTKITDPPCESSTPMAASERKDISWADEVDEDTAVDDFIASVVINDTNLSINNTLCNQVAPINLPNTMGVPGLKPVPDLRKLNPQGKQGQQKMATEIRDAAKSTGNINTRDTQHRNTTNEKGAVNPTPDTQHGLARNQQEMNVRSNGDDVMRHPNVQQQGAANDPQRNGNTKTNTNGIGARPKNTISGESMRFRDNVPKGAMAMANDDTKGASTVNTGKETYADMASKNRWNPPPSKRKRTKSSPKAFKPISGATINENKDIYVRGLATKNFTNSEELEDSVRYYCRERGVNIVFARVMTNSVNTNAVGCRVCIREEDLDAVYEDGFWPNKVEVREWYQKPRDRRPSRNFNNASAAYEG